MTFERFWGVTRSLRVMPLEHVLFMTFLYYDNNNDGYICDYDLEKLMNLSLLRPLLKHDYQRMKKSGRKKRLTCREKYLELYRWGEVTESSYFEWKQKLGKGSSSADAEL